MPTVMNTYLPASRNVPELDQFRAIPSIQVQMPTRAQMTCCDALHAGSPYPNPNEHPLDQAFQDNVLICQNVPMSSCPFLLVVLYIPPSTQNTSERSNSSTMTVSLYCADNEWRLLYRNTSLITTLERGHGPCIAATAAHTNVTAFIY